jgi:hypothetical protein
MEWYRVSFDETYIYREAAPPGGEAWRDELAWARIIRVCFKAGDFLDPDEIYLFTDDRPESYLIPTSAEGGSALFGALIERKLIPADEAIEAMSKPDELVCWPAV